MDGCIRAARNQTKEKRHRGKHVLKKPVVPLFQSESYYNDSILNNMSTVFKIAGLSGNTKALLQSL